MPHHHTGLAQSHGQSRVRRGALALVAVAAGAFALAAPAQAGTYEVTACNASPDFIANDSWVSAASPSMQATATCPGTSNEGGMVAAHQVGGPEIQQGATATFAFSAPEGTKITGILQGGYRFVQLANSGWRAGLYTAEGTTVFGAFDTNEIGVGLSPTNAQMKSIAPTDKLIARTECLNQTCPTDSGLRTGHYAYFRLYHTRVRVDDQTKPTIDNVNAQWSPTSYLQDGAKTISFDAVDGSGIAEAAIAIDGTDVKTDTRTGTFTKTRPFANGGTSHTIDVGQLTEGVHTVALRAKDAGANVQTLERELRVDRTAPTVTAANQPTTKVTENASIELKATDALSGMAGGRIEYELDGKPVTVQGEQATVDVAAVGAHELRFRAIDAAGVLSEWKTVAFEIARPADPQPQVNAERPEEPRPVQQPTPEIKDLGVRAAQGAPPAAAPSTPVRSSPQIKLAKLTVAKKNRRIVTVRGTTARAVTGRVTLTVTYTVGRKTRKLTKTIAVRNGRFAARVTLGSRKWKSVKVTASYAGDARFNAQQNKRVLKSRS
jgi:hypothetical protein